MTHPLEQPPPDSLALRRFIDFFRLDAGARPDRLLDGVALAFSKIPYENLTKIVSLAEAGSPEKARRGPLEVVSGHIDFGAGGTCFSLTAALLHILRALGWRAEPILADRHYGDNTHCALLVWIGGEPHLLDPGYLLIQPVPLPGKSEARVPTPFNEIILTPRDSGERLELHTVHKGSCSSRLVFKTAPVDAGQFLEAWDASFGWDMMRYPVLNTVRGGEQIYLQDRRLQVRGLDSVERRELPAGSIIESIRETFGIDPRIAARALTILRRSGEGGGA